MGDAASPAAVPSPASLLRPVSYLLPVVYGLIHALVDATCVSSVFRALPIHDLTTRDAFLLVVGYDVIAFGGQAPLGWLIDRWRSPREAMLLGILLTAGAAFAFRWHPWATMVLAGTGNALFHLGAGAYTLYHRPGRSAPLGVYVAPGALGLALGLWMGKTGHGPLWPLLLGLGFGAVAVWTLRRPEIPYDPPASPSAEPPKVDGALLVMLLLLASIAVRSFVGLRGCRECPVADWVLVGAPLAAFAGKLLGGFASDRFGWIEGSLLALLAAAPLVAFGGGTPYLILPGLFFFQMTQPVTLAAAGLLLPRRPATAFGLTCLALILGALPTFFPWRKHLEVDGLFLAFTVLAAIAVAVALRRLGRANRVRGVLPMLYRPDAR